MAFEGIVLSSKWTNAGQVSTANIPALNDTEAPPNSMRILIGAQDSSTTPSGGFAGYTKIEQIIAQGVECVIAYRYTITGGQPATSYFNTTAIPRGFWDIIVTGIADAPQVSFASDNSAGPDYRIPGLNTTVNDAFCIWALSYDGTDCTITGTSTLVTRPWTNFEAQGQAYSLSPGAAGVTVGWGFQNEPTIVSLTGTPLTGTFPTDGWAALSASFQAVAPPVPPVTINIKSIDGVQLETSQARDGVPIYD